jgi:uncharacterized protein (DUF433 family)
MEVHWPDYIESNPEILSGRPVFKGSRLSVQLMLELMSEGWTRDDMTENYPDFTDERLRAALGLAAAAVQSVSVDELAAKVEEPAATEMVF